MVATIPTAQGVNFVVGGGVVTEVRGFLDRLASNSLWQAQLNRMAAGGKTTIVVTDDPNDIPATLGNFQLRASMYGNVYNNPNQPGGEVGGNTRNLIGGGFAWILFNQSDGVYPINGQTRDRFTIFVHEVMHVADNPLAAGGEHNPLWTSRTQAVLDFSGVPQIDPNKALNPGNGVVFGGSNPTLVPLGPQTPGVPNPG